MEPRAWSWSPRVGVRWGVVVGTCSQDPKIITWTKTKSLTLNQLSHLDDQTWDVFKIEPNKTCNWLWHKLWEEEKKSRSILRFCLSKWTNDFLFTRNNILISCMLINISVAFVLENQFGIYEVLGSPSISLSIFKMLLLFTSNANSCFWKVWW